jgi:hypothetical protein
MNILFCATCGRPYADSRPACECQGPTKTFRDAGQPSTAAALVRKQPAPPAPQTRHFQRRDCPYCGHPIVPRVERSGRGFGPILIGSILAPVIIGIPVLIYGLILSCGRYEYMECIGCHKRFGEQDILGWVARAFVIALLFITSWILLASIGAHSAWLWAGLGTLLFSLMPRQAITMALVAIIGYSLVVLIKAFSS